MEEGLMLSTRMSEMLEEWYGWWVPEAPEAAILALKPCIQYVLFCIIWERGRAGVEEDEDEELKEEDGRKK